MLKKYSLKALQTAINHALSMDPDLPQKMKNLEGKILHLLITPLNTGFYVSFGNGQMILMDAFDGVIDTTIQSNPLGLIRLSLLPASEARSLFNDKIRISGDVETGQQIKQLFDTLDIDWEGHLAHFTGDVIACQVGSFVRRGLAFGQQLKSSMQWNTRDYLQEELGILPTRQELVDLYTDIDEVTMGVERLQARIDLMDAHEND